MKKILIMSLGILFPIVLCWGSEKLRIVIQTFDVRSSIDSVYITDFYVRENRERLVKIYGGMCYTCMKDDIVVLNDWNKDIGLYWMTVDWIGGHRRMFTTPIDGGKDSHINSEDYIVWTKNDIEADCYNDRSEFFLMDSRGKLLFSVSTEQKEFPSLFKDLKIAYSDSNPRGAGNNGTALIKLLDLGSGSVRIIAEFSDEEYPYWGMIQWMSQDVLSYMTIKEERTLYKLNFYTCERKDGYKPFLISSVPFSGSLYKLGYRVYNGVHYVRNDKSIYVLEREIA